MAIKDESPGTENSEKTDEHEKNGNFEERPLPNRRNTRWSDVRDYREGPRPLAHWPGLIKYRPGCRCSESVE
ncbi:hypothetical protein EVAR_100555_1 [Eumeta japonica]|uniref:Uncharacterized protein n=1 Tax=Eumeta variegata TaxID=151549 RepID=A0A4C2A066_EUMVA|nr:hypothetical protein EVAR_100555_1 [Eumeta japonica]